MSQLMRFIILFTSLMSVWLLMSGHYTVLVTSLGVLSVLFATVMSARLGGTDTEALPLHIMGRLPGYFLWLFKEIIMSNITTAKVILSNSADPEMFETRASQQTEAGLATYANSITLTPGTVTVDIDQDRFLVHALTADFGQDVRALDMDEKVSALETLIKTDSTETKSPSNKGDA